MPASVMIAPVGASALRGASKFINVNEVTTAATVTALAQYINPGTTTPGSMTIGTNGDYTAGDRAAGWHRPAQRVCDHCEPDDSCERDSRRLLTTATGTATAAATAVVDDHAGDGQDQHAGQYSLGLCELDRVQFDKLHHAFQQCDSPGCGEYKPAGGNFLNGRRTRCRRCTTWRRIRLTILRRRLRRIRQISRICTTWLRPRRRFSPR